MDCHVANALAMTWVAPLAMTWVAPLEMTERAYDCNDGGGALLAMGKATSLRGRMPKQSRHA